MKTLVVSDLHVGSFEGLTVPKFVVKMPNGDKRVFLATTDQLKLWKLWVKMIRDVGPVDALLIAGDTVDGHQERDKGKHLWTNDIALQVRVAVQLLGMIPIKHPKNRWLVTGSHYHVEENANFDGLVAQQLGLGEQHYGPELYINLGGKTVHLQHFIGVSMSSYRTTSIEREKLMALLAEDMTGIKTDIVVRGHAHYHRLVKDYRNIGFINPCWQFRTPFCAKRIGLAAQPEIGYTVIEIDGDDVSVDTTIHKTVQKPEVGRCVSA
jgi:predicted phosphodiesterase